MVEENFTYECFEIRSRLGEYLDGKTNNEFNEKVSKHLDNCSGCEDFYEELMLDDYKEYMMFER